MRPGPRFGHRCFLLRLLLPLAALGWILASTGPAMASTVLRWQAKLEPGHVAVVDLLLPTADGGEQRLARFLTTDNGTQTRLGWRPDTDPARGSIAASIELDLPPGLYLYSVRDAQGTRRTALFLRAPKAATPPLLTVPAPTGSSAIMGWREQRDGNDGFAWAPVEAGQAGLRLSPGRWRLVPLQVGGFGSEDIDVRPGQPTQSPSFRRRGAPVRRVLSGQAWVVRYLLAPLTVLLLLAAGVGLWKARRIKGLGLAIVVSTLVAAIALRAALAHPESVLLAAGAPIEDPADSVGLLSTITQSIPTLSDRANVYSFPEGASWLRAGPAWLGYLPAAPVAALAGPIAGHNLGVMLGCGMLCLSAWGLARGLGASPPAALLAGLATALGPTALDELDAQSLDRATLYLVPLALLCLHRAATRPGWRWPLAAGLALAAVFYGQVYFGLYLAAAAPWLVLTRLFGPAPLRRLARLAMVGAVALLVLAPGLVALKLGTAGTNYQPQNSDGAQRPMDAAQAADFLRSHDPTLAPQAVALPMDTPRLRRMTATALGFSLPEVLRPAELMPGRALYWPLALLALVLTRRERRLAAAVALSDVAVLMLHGMGPDLRPTLTTLGPPLPFALDMALIPGFDQLKNSQRYGLLAASVAAVPLALGLDGLFARLPRRAIRIVGVPLALSLALLLVAVRLPWTEPVLGPRPKPRSSPRALASLDLRWPSVRAVPTVTAWKDIEGPVLALPLRHPTPRPLVLAAAADGLRLANPPSFDEADNSLPLWVEDNALLNRLDWSAGGDRAGLWLELDPETAQAEALALRQAGLAYISLHRDLLPGPELVAETEALLDSKLRRVADDGTVAVWVLPRSSE